MRANSSAAALVQKLNGCNTQEIVSNLTARPAEVSTLLVYLAQNVDTTFNTRGPKLVTLPEHTQAFVLILMAALLHHETAGLGQDTRFRDLVSNTLDVRQLLPPLCSTLVEALAAQLGVEGGDACADGNAGQAQADPSLMLHGIGAHPSMQRSAADCTASGSKQPVLHATSRTDWPHGTEAEKCPRLARCFLQGRHTTKP
jgi:hypothetical protein